MTQKSEIISLAAENFIQFGSKHITMDGLATLLGISKKTIYKHFSSKEDLVVESINLQIFEFKKDVTPIFDTEESSLNKIITIYDVVFDYILKFKPSFIFGLQKYYPEAYKIYKDFTRSFVNKTMVQLLNEAQQNSEIRSDVNIELFAQLYFWDLETRLYGTDKLFESYSKETLLEYMIINNLRGIKK